MTARTRREQRVASADLQRDAPARHGVQHIAAPRARRRHDRSGTVHRLVGIRTVVEQQLDDLEVVVARQRMVQRARRPARRPRGVGAVLKQPAHTVHVVPVALAKQHRRQGIGRATTALDQRLHHRIVVTLRRVVGDLVVIRVGPAREQECGERSVTRECGGAIEHRAEARSSRRFKIGEARGHVRAGVQ